MIGLLGRGFLVLLGRRHVNGSSCCGSPNERKHAEIGASAAVCVALLITTLTTVGGMAPLLMETSFQAQFLIPVAISLSYGLAYATILVLFVVPALVGIAHDVGQGFTATKRFLFGGPRTEPAESA